MTDNGGEYLSSAFQNYLKEKGIRHELTMPHSPQQNGVSERMNRTQVESARSMIAHAGLSNIFLAEAAAYVRNRLPTVALNCLLYTSPSPRDQRGSRMPSSA